MSIAHLLGDRQCDRRREKCAYGHTQLRLLACICGENQRSPGGPLHDTRKALVDYGRLSTFRGPEEEKNLPKENGRSKENQEVT